MQIFKTKRLLSKELDKIRGHKKIGVIPTMGCLHKGHISLIKESLKICDVTICTIFINPTQFNNITDFQNYPTSLKEDLIKLEEINCDIIYAPDTNDLYDQNETVKEYMFGDITKIMEGKYRPGHFNGVATIVEKLFHIINPQKAFFGEKDLQQLQIVKKLVNQKKLNIDVIGLPTIREKNGLAKSSRNQLLSEKEKKEATLIYRSLLYCKENMHLGIHKLKKNVTKQINSNKHINLEYIEFVETKDMKRIEKFDDNKSNAICIAAYVNEIRLIDNIIL
jgi:pantoate--beta-alanine ligase